MNAVTVYPAQKKIACVTDEPEPSGPLAATQVRVQILEVGLCGTDKEIAQFKYGTPPPACDRLVIGHESLGQVMEVGTGVTGLQSGDLVVATVRRPCNDPNCPACAIGRQDFCYTGKYTERGIKELDGYMTEVIVEEAQYLHKVDPAIRDFAVLTEPLTISRKALRQLFDIQDRLPWACSIPEHSESGKRPTISCRRALVLGAGPVGLLGAMCMVDAGFETLVYSRVSGMQERVEITKAIGATFVDAESVASGDLLNKIGQVDVVLEAVGASRLAFEILQLLGPNAIFMFTGVPGLGECADIDVGQIMRNLVLGNQALVGTVNAAPEDFDSAIESLSRFDKRWPGILKRLITTRLQPKQVPDALTGKGAPAIKTIVTFTKDN